jgi:hypothetical protein
MSITGGSVTFEQSRKLAEYENRKVGITFNVNEENGDRSVEQVLQALTIARSAVFVALGLPASADVISVEAVLGAAVGGEASGDADPAKPAGKPRGKRPPAVQVTTRETPKTDAEVKADAAATVVEKTTQGTNAAEVVEEVPTNPTGVTVGSTASSTPSSDAATIDESLFAPAAAEITDADLLGRISRKNQELSKALGPQAPVKIRELIGKYVQAPKSARDIDQSLRTKFCTELEALAP